jgi:effector-binding domain-containing protein
MTQVLFATIKPRTLAAVRRRVPPRDVPAHFKAPLDMVWAFLGNHPGLRTDWHNVFLYHHPPGSGPTTPMDIDFGVEVSRDFANAGDIMCIETPAGEAAIAIHRGPYQNMFATHQAIHAAVAARGRTSSHSMEIYGDWTDDESKLEVEIVYLLA